MHTNNDNPKNHDKPKLNDEKALRQADVGTLLKKDFGVRRVSGG